MKVTLVDAVFFLFFFAESQATYDLSKYERIGCYGSVVDYSQIIFTDLDRHSDKWSGYSVNWYNWGYYLKGLVWHCGQKAKEKNLAYFGIQNIGECWGRSSPLPDTSSSSPYSSSSSSCVNTGYNTCPSNPSQSDICAGKKGSSFVYHNPGVHACSRKLDIVIGVDASASISNDSFNEIKDFLHRLVASFAITEDAARFIIFHFDKEAYTTIPNFDQSETRDRSGVKDQINKLTFTLGSTVIPAAIEEVQKYYNLSGVRKSDEAARVAVFITDGHTFDGVDTLKHPAHELRSVSNARAVAFGVGGSLGFVDTEALKIITGYENRHQMLYFSNNDDELSKAVKLICDSY